MNKDIGNSFEARMIGILSSNGYWCHLFAYKPEGQPCDIVASKDNVPVFIDVKHCSGSRFGFDNIRTNQRNCFSLAYERGNSNCGFAIYFEGCKGWKWISYSEVLRLESLGHRSAGIDDCVDFPWN